MSDDFTQPEFWECTPMLRWADGILQQFWYEKTTGKHEWRIVPNADEMPDGYG